MKTVLESPEWVAQSVNLVEHARLVSILLNIAYPARGVPMMPMLGRID